MNIVESIKISLKMLTRNKLQSFLTMLGIVIGIMSVVIAMSVGAGAQEFILNEIKILGTDLIAISSNISASGSPLYEKAELKYEDGERLKHENIDVLTMYVHGMENISLEGDSRNVFYRGTTENHLFIENAKIDKGRFFTKDEDGSASKVVVLGSKLAKDLFGESDPINQKVKIQKTNFKVVGVLQETVSNIDKENDNSFLIPIKTAQKLLINTDKVNYIIIKVKDEAKLDSTISDIKESLREMHDIDEEDAFTVNTTAEALETLKTITNAIKFFLVAVAAVSLLVGGFGIMTIMLATVEERIKEIGLRKAVGAKNSQIVLQFLIEAVVITFLSGLIGIILGILISFLIYKIILFMGTEWFFIVPVDAIIAATLISIAIGLVFGILPAKKASKLNPVEALRYE